MAEFSKQYMENKGHEGYDFDPYVQVSKIKNGECIPLICEGYGYTHAGKSTGGDLMLFFPADQTESEEGEWVFAEEFFEGN